MMDARLKLEVSFDSIERAKNILDSLKPDNIKIPKDMSLEMISKNSSIIIEIKGSNLRRLRSTLEEILALISSMEKLKTI